MMIRRENAQSEFGAGGGVGRIGDYEAGAGGKISETVIQKTIDERPGPCGEGRMKNAEWKARRADIFVESQINKFSSSVQERHILENRRMMPPRRG